MQKRAYVTNVVIHRHHRTIGLLTVVISLMLIVSSPSGSAQLVKIVQVPGAWEVIANGPNQCGTCDEFPLTLGLGAPERVPQGIPVDISVGFSSRIPSTMVLRRPVTLRVRIERASDSGCCPVAWEGILPPLTGSIPPGSATLRFVWDQRDSSGRPVPPGKYGAAVEYPITIPYTIGGASGEERLTPTSGHLLGGEFSFATIEISSVNQFYGPQGIFVDRAGRIYVADSGNNRIIRMDNMTGAGLLTLGGRQGAGVNQFYGPADIFVDDADRIYVADTINDRIIRVNDMTGAGWTSLGTSGSGVGQFNRPTGVFVDGAGRIYIVDHFNNRVVRVNDMTGAGWTVLKTSQGGADQLSFPVGVFVDKEARIYVTDTIHVVRVDDMAGAGWTSLGTRQGSGVNQFSLLSGIFADGAGRVYVGDSANSRIVRVDDMTGAGWTTLGMCPQPLLLHRCAGVGQFSSPTAIFVDGEGRIYVADSNNDRIVRVDNMTGAGWITVGTEAAR